MAALYECSASVHDDPQCRAGRNLPKQCTTGLFRAVHASDLGATFGFAVGFGSVEPALAFACILASAAAFGCSAQAFAFAFVDATAVDLLFNLFGSRWCCAAFGFVFFACVRKQASRCKCDEGAFFDTYHAHTMPNLRAIGEALRAPAATLHVRITALLLGGITAATIGCGDNQRIAPRGDGVCGTIELGFPLVAGAHVPVCSPVTYNSNPPTSGPHYPNWAKFQRFAAPVGRPFWVHDLEHGAIVISYNCPDGCAQDLDALQAMLAVRPADANCTAAVRNRFVITPDPLLDVKFAASAWGFALRSDCFDLAALSDFIDAHYAQGPEDVCADGIDVLDPRNEFPANCP